MNPIFDWIENQAGQMEATLEEWVNINSHYNNLTGLQQMRQVLLAAFAPLGGKSETIQLPPRHTVDQKGEIHTIPQGEIISIIKHPNAPTKVFLGGHMDTVFPLSSSFQKAVRLNKEKMRGPGIADMKGGLVVLLTTLQALERSAFAGQIGWEVLINPNEEVGSPGAESFFHRAAHRNQLGLLFEPALPNGDMVSARKGSLNFTLMVKGRAAHVGRDYTLGRNAIHALAEFIGRMETWVAQNPTIIFNAGQIAGGEAANIVPDQALCKCNLRIDSSEDLRLVRQHIQQSIEDVQKREGIQLAYLEEASRPPKQFDQKTAQLFDQLKQCGSVLGLSLSVKPTGGVCDGNILADAGLPTIDTLGVIGEGMHTHDEYLILSSLVERTKLTTYFLSCYA